MPDYPHDEDGRPTTRIPPPTPTDALERGAAALEAWLPRIEQALRQQIARYPRPIPPDQWDRLVTEVTDEVTERLRSNHDPANPSTEGTPANPR